MSSFKTLCNEMELLVQYPEVGLAISDSTTPVPGYLYGEINAITYIDYGSNCKFLVNFLISRLQLDTPLVSIKILKLLLYLAKNGHTEITEQLKYHEVALKQAMGFHGPPDNHHGTIFYENIRQLSKELLEYIFSENKGTPERTISPSLPELSGYGSSASSTGFGFSVKNQKTVSEIISDGVTNFVEKLLPGNEKEPKEQSSHLKEALPQYKPLVISKDETKADVSSNAELCTSQKSISTNRIKQKSRAYKPGKPGGGWDDSDEEEEDEPVDSAKENISKTSSSFDCIEINKMEVKDNIIDWADEHKIVDAFTVNEPLNKIEYTSVSTLCKRCASLNCDQILFFLLEKLEEEKEMPQLRALILVEYLIFHDIVTLESLMKILLQPLKNFIEKAEEAPHSVKIKAKKVCLIIHNLGESSHALSNQLAQTTIKCNS